MSGDIEWDAKKGTLKGSNREIVDRIKNQANKAYAEGGMELSRMPEPGGGIPVDKNPLKDESLLAALLDLEFETPDVLEKFYPHWDGDAQDNEMRKEWRAEGYSEEEIEEAIRNTVY